MSSNCNKPGKKLSVKEMRNLKGGAAAESKCLPLGATCGGECIYPFPVCCPGTYCTGFPGRGNPIGSCVYGDKDVEAVFDVAPHA